MSADFDNPNSNDNVTNTGNQGQDHAGSDDAAQLGRTSAHAAKMKIAQLYLPLFAQDESYLDLDTDVSEALRSYASNIGYVVELLRAIADAVTSHTVTIDFDRAFVLVTGPTEMIDDLIDKCVLMEADWLNAEVPTGHKTVRVRWKDLEAEIDEGIVPLILELWKADLPTSKSCEGDWRGFVWIEFLHASYAEQFLNIVARYEDDPQSLYNRIRGKWTPESGELEGAWRYRVDVEDFAVEKTDVNGETKETSAGPSQFLFALSVLFPPSDLPVILDRLKSYNENRGEGGNPASR